MRAARFVRKNNLTDSYVLITPGNVQGNSVVMIYSDNNSDGVYDTQDGDVILWSWHIWVSNDKDAILAGSTTATDWMDRNLGALYNSYNADEVNVMGLHYQFGRKDPFPGMIGFMEDNEICRTVRPVYGSPILLEEEDGVYAQATIAQAMQNPGRLYRPGPFQGDNWCSENTEATYLWNDPAANGSGKKSIFDPCPEGWRVPESAEWGADHHPAWGSDQNNGRINNQFGGYYPYTGSFYGESSSNTYAGYNGSYWTSTATDNKRSRILQIQEDDVYSGITRDSHSRADAISVRCTRDDA